MYLSPAQLIYSTAFGATKPSKAETAIYETLSAALSGTFDPTTAVSPTKTLLDLSTPDPSGLTMFDVLAKSYGGNSSTFDLLAAYSR
jgi:hypothetical protein